MHFLSLPFMLHALLFHQFDHDNSKTRIQVKTGNEFYVLLAIPGHALLWLSLASVKCISYEAMKFVLRSDQPAPFHSQFPAIDVRISQLIDRFAAGYAYL
jgi:hypothetical protein